MAVHPHLSGDSLYSDLEAFKGDPVHPHLSGDSRRLGLALDIPTPVHPHLSGDSQKRIDSEKPDGVGSPPPEWGQRIALRCGWMVSPVHPHLSGDSFVHLGRDFWVYSVHPHLSGDSFGRLAARLCRYRFTPT